MGNYDVFVGQRLPMNVEEFPQFCMNCCDIGSPAGACFSLDRSSRYALWRTWEPSKPALLAVMLNPSIADEQFLDPTLKRVFNFARTWGYGAMWVANAFALVATDPSDLRYARLADACNDWHIRGMALRAARVMVGWGQNMEQPHMRFRYSELATLLSGIECMAWKTTKTGMPQHPLYLPQSTQPVPYEFLP